MIDIDGMKTLLESVQGFGDKVTYYEWPIDEAPPLPFVCFYSDRDEVFAADNVVYFAQPRFRVELYTKYRDPETEALFEAAFRQAGLYYTKETGFLADELCQMTVFVI